MHKRDTVTLLQLRIKLSPVNWICITNSLLILQNQNKIMTSIVLFYLVLFVACNYQCDGFTNQIGSLKLSTFSNFQEIIRSSIISSKGSIVMMSSTENAVAEVQLGRVTMYKKEGQSSYHNNRSNFFLH